MGIGEGQVAGLALGYAVFIEEESSICSELLAHEFRHVFQFEQVGGLDAFVAEYLRQVAFGYHQAPWEVDARECSKAVK